MKKTLTTKDLEARGWNSVESRILMMWIDGGMTLYEAEQRMSDDLADAAEEDGF